MHCRKTNKGIVNIYVDFSVWENFRILAIKKGTSCSKMLEKAMLEMLKENKMLLITRRKGHPLPDGISESDIKHWAEYLDITIDDKLIEELLAEVLDKVSDIIDTKQANNTYREWARDNFPLLRWYERFRDYQPPKKAKK